MPEDSKKNQQRNKNEPKDQRKRRGRQHSHVEKKVESKTPKVLEKPACEPPPPEFYMNLKRETDEILKITEEANSKYKKKEIQSNWAKYEMPIDSYEQIDEQENLGADYEALIRASLTVGGHFQFKHEKCWDTTAGPSPYDKYFDINTDNLYTALCTLPFYERNNIDATCFSESDIQNMNHRASKYKFKYHNDKKFATPEIEDQIKIINNLKSKKPNDSIQMSEANNQLKEANDDINYKMLNEFKDIKLEGCGEPEQSVSEESVNDSKNVDQCDSKKVDEIDAMHPSHAMPEKSASDIYEPKDLDLTIRKSESIIVPNSASDNNSNDEDDDDFHKIVHQVNKVKEKSETKIDTQSEALNTVVQKEWACTKAASAHKEQSATNPIIESPEDLEKWLDDFLDG